MAILLFYISLYIATSSTGRIAAALQPDDVHRTTPPPTDLTTAFRVNEPPTRIDCGIPPTPETIRLAGVAWHASIYTKSEDPYRQICGGTLISSTVVISAAQCFWDETTREMLPASQFAVAVGKSHRIWDSAEDVYSQTSDVKAIKLAPRFFGSLTHYGNDIALLNLTTPMWFTGHVMAVCLDLNTEELRLNSGTMGIIPTWGGTSARDSPSGVLQVAKTAHISYEDCLVKSSADFIKYLIVDKMCSEFNDTQLCDSDTGAGLVFLDSFRGRQRYYLRGVLSVPPRDGLCSDSHINGYTQISSHKQLISKNVVLNYLLSINDDCGVVSDEEMAQGILPWHANTYYERNNEFYPMCGGSVISTTIVISAAHCFINNISPMSVYAVRVGSRYLEWNSEDAYAQNFKISQISVPQNFNGGSGSFSNDIALLFLSTAIIFTKYVRPICVNFDHDFDRLQIQGRGGKMSEWAIDANQTWVRKVIDVPVVRVAECLQMIPPDYRYVFTYDKICATQTNGIRLSMGVSGSGLAFLDTYRGQQRYYLRGVLSVVPIGKFDGPSSTVPFITFTWLLALEQFISNFIIDAPRLDPGEDPSDWTECGTIPLHLYPLSIGGRPSYYSEVPWHAGIYRKKLNASKNVVYEQICGGTLISKSLVLSAAHCFASDEGKKKKPSHFSVAVGKLYREWDDPRETPRNIQKSNVSNIIMPDNFYGAVTRFQADIAIVKVSTEFQFRHHIVPVCLDFDYNFDNNQLKGGSFGKVAGWGYTSEDGFSSPVLKVLEEPIYNSSTCFYTIPTTSRELITTDKICGGYVDGTQALCKGDSGGGLVMPALESGVVKYYLRGIVSTATVSIKQCNRFSLTYFTRVRAHQYLITEWLKAQNDTSQSETVHLSEDNERQNILEIDLRQGDQLSSNSAVQLCDSHYCMILLFFIVIIHIIV